jgi:hypothetical protein
MGHIEAGESGSQSDPTANRSGCPSGYRKSPLGWQGAGSSLGCPAASGSGSGRDAVAYDDEEEAMVAERLRALGYLE